MKYFFKALYKNEPHKYINLIKNKVLSELNKYFDKNKIIIDCGCGYGKILNEIRTDKNNKIGIDIVFEHLKSGKNFLAAQGDCLNLPLKNNIADIVISVEVIEHLKNTEIFLNNIFNILKKNGIFIFTSSPIKPTIISFLLPLKNKIRPEIAKEHINIQNPAKLKKILLKNNFEILKIEYFNFLSLLQYLDRLNLSFLYKLLVKIDKFISFCYTGNNFIMIVKK